MMEDAIHDHLLPSEKGIPDELASSQSDWLLSVCHDGLLRYQLQSVF